MHAIVVGCGRVGRSVAGELVTGGHDVVVVDKSAASLARLGDDFAGRRLVGIGFDRGVLEEAGITADSAVMAVTSGDNSNILIARVARETFGVERVVARIYDPRRAEIYERLGIPTVASVAWASRRVLRAVLPGAAVEWTDPTSTHVLVERRVPSAAAGAPVSALAAVGARVALLVRSGTASVPADSVLLQQDDWVHVIVPVSSAELLEQMLAHGTQEVH
jgi:trk system potassium uptake protein TrkA